MTDEPRHDGHEPRDDAQEVRERLPIERAVRAYAVFLRSVEHHQRVVARFRLARDTHETLHSTLLELSTRRDAAAEGRLEIRSAIRKYVQALRAEHRAPEVVLRMTKHAYRAIVVAMPVEEALRNPEALLQDTVRWAIEAYYEAA
jgi:hypothetical protein